MSRMYGIYTGMKKNTSVDNFSYSYSRLNWRTPPTANINQHKRRLWRQLCFVLSKATEKRNKNTKISWWLAKKLFNTICYKTYYNSYIANRGRVVAWPEPEPLWSNGPRHIGYHRKALVIARMINSLTPKSVPAGAKKYFLVGTYSIST